jgi:hypothetical protein
MHRHVGDGNFHAALIFDKRIPGEFEKVDEAAHRVCLLLFWSFELRPCYIYTSEMVKRDPQIQYTQR